MNGADHNPLSREFNQDASKAKKAAEAGPVIITDRGWPAHVLLTFAEYRRITGGRARIADLLAMPGVEDVEIVAIRRREPSSEPGSMGTSCPRSRVASWSSTPPWHGGAHGSTCRILTPCATGSSPRWRSCTG